ncbi:MAG TPA: threonine ammonia-lyase [Firmicutes bacterium]|nr:threonine ammonia-lyase [Bacillota bacterium]
MDRLERFHEARRRLSGVIRVTPLDHSVTFSRMTGADVYLKLENLQKTGSFKIRGAWNKISRLSAEEKAKGVVAASAGNHAQGVALAATEAGISCTIVMPAVAPLAKVEATRGYGARVVLKGSNYDEAYEEALRITKETDAAFVHPFDDEEIIAGQGTISLEIMEQLPEVDVLVVPIGGGGLASGIAMAAKEIKPSVRVFGVQAAGAPSMVRSLAGKKPTALDSVNTIADGIAVKKPGGLTFDYCRKYLDGVVTVDDDQIAHAMLLLLERAKLVAEGAGAASLAALVSGKIPCPGKKVVAIISGGNVDVNLMSRIIEHGLSKAGRYMQIVTRVPDRPGSLLKLLNIIASEGANVVSVEHDRLRQDLVLGQAEVEIRVETYGPEHMRRIEARLAEAGYDAIHGSDVR